MKPSPPSDAPREVSAELLGLLAVYGAEAGSDARLGCHRGTVEVLTLLNAERVIDLVPVVSDMRKDAKMLSLVNGSSLT